MTSHELAHLLLQTPDTPVEAFCKLYGAYEEVSNILYDKQGVRTLTFGD